MRLRRRKMAAAPILETARCPVCRQEAFVMRPLWDGWVALAIHTNDAGLLCAQRETRIAMIDP